jgi:hypothetical protein
LDGHIAGHDLESMIFEEPCRQGLSPPTQSWATV